MTNDSSSDRARSEQPGLPPTRTLAARDVPPLEDPHAALERAFIDEFLRARGHTLRSVAALPPDEMSGLLRAAVAHATLRLTEIEARAHYVSELHD